jgi:hypothetical protein
MVGLIIGYAIPAVHGGALAPWQWQRHVRAAAWGEYSHGDPDRCAHRASDRASGRTGKCHSALWLRITPSRKEDTRIAEVQWPRRVSHGSKVERPTVAHTARLLALKTEAPREPLHALGDLFPDVAARFWCAYPHSTRQMGLADGAPRCQWLSMADLWILGLLTSVSFLLLTEVGIEPVASGLRVSSLTV